VRDLWSQDLPDREGVIRFLRAVGSNPDQFPPEMLAEAMPWCSCSAAADRLSGSIAAGRGHRGRLSQAGRFRGHHPGFDAMCTDLARRIGVRTMPLSKAPATRSSSPVSHSTRYFCSTGRRSHPESSHRPSPSSRARLAASRDYATTRRAGLISQRVQDHNRAVARRQPHAHPLRHRVPKRLFAVRSAVAGGEGVASANIRSSVTPSSTIFTGPG
jgi:hypothetical protein